MEPVKQNKDAWFVTIVIALFAAGVCAGIVLVSHVLPNPGKECREAGGQWSVMEQVCLPIADPRLSNS